MSGFFDPKATRSGALDAPATQRNKTFIAEVLARHLPARGLVLEVASGTGQHVVHLAASQPQLWFQPTDPDPRHLQSIAAWISAAGVRNVYAPLFLDVLQDDWPLQHADAVLNINMIHISPWQATLALMQGAGRVLPTGAPLYLYGPYKQGQVHTSASNAAFDESLRRTNPEWGVRDLEAVVQAAEQAGFKLMEVVPMPANNLSVIFSRQ